jgi:hypothetical protein
MCVASRFEVRVYVGVCAVLLVVIIWPLMAVRGSQGHARGPQPTHRDIRISSWVHGRQSALIRAVFPFAVQPGCVADGDQQSLGA